MVVKSHSKPFRRNGILYRWQFFTTPKGVALKKKEYYHRKAEKWIPTPDSVLPHRGGQ